MFMAKTIDDGELRQEIILTLDAPSGKPLHRHLQILILQIPSVHDAEPTMPKLVLLVEIVRCLLQILETELPQRPRQFLQRPQDIRARHRIPLLPDVIHKPHRHNRHHHRRDGGSDGDRHPWKLVLREMLHRQVPPAHAVELRRAACGRREPEVRDLIHHASEVENGSQNRRRRHRRGEPPLGLLLRDVNFDRLRDSVVLNPNVEVISFSDRGEFDSEWSQGGGDIGSDGVDVETCVVGVRIEIFLEGVELDGDEAVGCVTVGGGVGQTQILAVTVQRKGQVRGNHKGETFAGGGVIQTVEIDEEGRVERRDSAGVRGGGGAFPELERPIVKDSAGL
ncbi:hypothetical protein U1Q18_039918 [Sarracenia purpurea var. burkii]